MGNVSSAFSAFNEEGHGRITSLIQDKRTLLCTISVLVVIVVVVCSMLGVFTPSKYRIAEYEKLLSFHYVPIERAMNQSADPCEDFYEFACGSWESYVNRYTQGNFITPFSILQNSINTRAKEIFKTSHVNKNYPKVVNSAINFYQTCLKSSEPKAKVSHTALIKFLKEVGGFPLLNKGWKASTFNWANSCSVILRWLGVDTFLSAQVGVDELEAERNILLIKPPDPGRVIYDDQTIKIILYCIVSTLANSDPPNQDEFFSEVERLHKLERKILETSKLYNRTAEPVRLSLKKLQVEVPEVDWLTFFQRITNETLCSTKGCITEDEIILVSEMNYIKNICKIMSSEDQRTVANLIGWFIVRELSPFMPSAIRKYANHFGFSEIDNVEIITKRCYEKTMDMFADALSYLYIHQTPDFDRNGFTEMMDYLKDSFRSLIGSCTWLDKLTKHKILNKLDVMCEIIGYSKILKEKRKLDNIYSGFPQITRNSIENILNTWKYFVSKNLLILRTRNRRGFWFPPRPVTHVGAYYVVDRNTIVIPMVMQHKPFFYYGGPRYLSFGAIGSMIGHEINHGYDTIGRKRDKLGSVRNWWPDEAIAEHNSRLECFESQFNNYFIDGTNIKVNGTKTISENIADTTGLDLAYLAYKKWEKENGKEHSYAPLSHLSSDQLFFIGFASQYCAAISPQTNLALAAIDPHSPPRARIIGTISNLEAFARAYKCKRGSPMNPVNKCRIW